MAIKNNISKKARELSSEAFDLSVEDRKWLIRALRRGIKMDRFKECEQKYSGYVQIMEDIKGKKMCSTERGRFDKFASSVIAYQLRNDGFTCETIGGVMKRSPSTIEYKILNVGDVLGRIGFQRETQLYDQFKKKVYDIH